MNGRLYEANKSFSQNSSVQCNRGENLKKDALWISDKHPKLHENETKIGKIILGRRVKKNKRFLLVRYHNLL